MLVDDHQTASDYLPSRLALVAPPIPMALKQHGLDIMASKAKLPRLVERMMRPSRGNRVGRHERRLPADPVASATATELLDPEHKRSAASAP